MTDAAKASRSDWGKAKVPASVGFSVAMVYQLLSALLQEHGFFLFVIHAWILASVLGALVSTESRVVAAMVSGATYCVVMFLAGVLQDSLPPPEVEVILSSLALMMAGVILSGVIGLLVGVAVSLYRRVTGG